MLPSYLLTLREGLEAALIIGIALGALQKIRRTDLAPMLWLGAFSAAGVSVLFAVLLAMLRLNFVGVAEKIYEGATMFLAAGILTWMIFWMREQARNIKTELEDGIHKAATSKASIFWLAFIAIIREGVELALFIVAAFFVGANANVTSATIQTLAGVALGLGTSVLLGWSLLASTARLNLKRFFHITSYMLILFAAGLVAHGINEFNLIGWIPSVVKHVWDINAVLDETSITGEFLKALFGYNGNPSLTEIIGYLAYVGVTLVLFMRPTVAKETRIAQAT